MVGQRRGRSGPARGAVAGAGAAIVGTFAMDLLWYVRYRRDGGTQGPWAWETAEGLQDWDSAPTPGQVGRRLVETITHRSLPDSAARPTTNVVHWATGLAWGAQLGMAGSVWPRRRWTLALLFGPVVWLTSYVVMPMAKLYKPIWDYDRKTLGKDLSAHLVYGAVTASVFNALSR